MIWVELDGGVCYELGDDRFLLMDVKLISPNPKACSSAVLVCQSIRASMLSPVDLEKYPTQAP